MTPLARVRATADLRETIQKAVADLGGFRLYVRPGDRVLIKPNFNTADPPPASTALDFLSAVVELVYGAGAGQVVVGESSTFMAGNHSTRRMMAKAGVDRLLTSPRPPQIHVFDEHEWVTKDLPSARYLPRVSVPRILDEVDRVVLLPCCKTHRIAGFTGALKLAVGFMKPSERLALHVGRVAEKVAELNTVYTPDLVLMDARRCFITGGPARGEVREPGLVLASTSRVAIDREEVRIIQSFPGNALAGQDPDELPQLRRARELGLT